MTVEEAYVRYLSKVEKNSTNDNISTDKQRFVLLFNETQVKFLEALIDRRGDDDVRYIQKFLVPDVKIPYTSKLNNRYQFSLPKDYLDISDVYALATKNECKNKKINLFVILAENKTEVLKDAYNSPSFEWREAPYFINSDTIDVFTTDFVVNHAILSYYRYPKSIRQINNNPESNFDETQIIEWDEKSLNRIISACAGEFDINEADQRWQLQKQRAIQKQ